MIARQVSVAAADARLRRELAEILPVLERVTGAPALLLKGAAVADRFYPQARLRSFRDLDVMVPRARLNDAVRALEMSFGYFRLAEPWPGYGERHGHHVALARAAHGGALVVELHWRVSDDPAAPAPSTQARGDGDFLSASAHVKSLALARRYRLGAVRFSATGDGGRYIRLPSGDVTRLNAGAAAVMDACCAGPASTALEALVARYPGAPRERLTNDAIATVNRLVRRGVLVPSAAGA